MKRFSTTWYLANLPLLQGCYYLNNDGSKSTDGAAMICGVVGVVALLAGFGKPSFRAIIAGVILLIA